MQNLTSRSALLGLVVDVPSIMQRQVPAVLRWVCKLWQKTVEFHSCVAVDVAVPMQRQVSAVLCLRFLHRTRS